MIEYERSNKERRALWVRITDWHSPTVPKLARGLLLFGAVCMGLSCYMVGLAGSLCFKTFQVCV